MEGPAEPSSLPVPPLQSLPGGPDTRRFLGGKFQGLGGCQQGVSLLGHTPGPVAFLCSCPLASPGAPFLTRSPPASAGVSVADTEPRRAVHSWKTFSLVLWARSSLGQRPRRIRVRYQKVPPFLVLSPAHQPIRELGNRAGMEERWGKAGGDEAKTGVSAPANPTLTCH